MQHDKIAIWENATWKTCRMEIMQLDQSATWKECNMKKEQREKCPTWKKSQKWNMGKKVHKNSALECTDG